MPRHLCTICQHGCRCTPTEPGCRHYGCHGAHPTRDCPGVADEETRYVETRRQARAIAARHHNTRARWAASYRAAVIASFPAAR